MFHLTVFPRRIVYVNAAATGAADGTSWADAFPSFAAALANGDGCSEVWVAAGSYTPDGNQPAHMKSGLEIYGGFSGTETAREQRDWTNNPTILCATAAASIIANRGDVTPLDRTALLDGFIVTSVGHQIAIDNYYASPTIRNCVLETNSYWAIESVASSPLIDTCVFRNNFDTALDLRSGTPLVTNCLFTGNQSPYGAGAIEILSGTRAAILGCSFVANLGGGYGGGDRELGRHRGDCQFCF